MTAGAAHATSEKQGPESKAAKPAAKKAPPAKPKAPELPDASDEQRAAADMAYYGTYDCEFKQILNVDHSRTDGYVDVRFAKQVFTMKPVLSSTGALRMEDIKGQMLLLQIANKSMLMDTKAGRRVVDECMHEKQVLTRKAMEAGPPQEGLGIDPSRNVAPAVPVAPVAPASSPEPARQ
jgi:hypothetical protein